MCICRSGIQLESEFGLGPVFVLSTDTVFICGCDILQEGEQSCLTLNCYFLRTGYCRSMPNMLHTVHSANHRQSNSAIIGKPNRRYNCISNGKPPNLILSGNWWTWQEYHQCGPWHSSKSNLFTSTLRCNTRQEGNRVKTMGEKRDSLSNRHKPDTRAWKKKRVSSSRMQ